MQIYFSDAGIALTCLVRKPRQAGVFGSGVAIRLDAQSGKVTRKSIMRQEPGAQS